MADVADVIEPETTVEASVPDDGGQRAPEPAEQPAAKAVAEQHVPYTRFREVNDERKRYAEELATVKAELDAERRRIQALAGVTPADPRAKEAEQIRKALEEVAPELREISELKKAIDEQRKQAAAREQAQFDAWGDTTIAALDDAGKRLFGAKTLSSDQQDVLVSSYIAWAKRDPNRQARYNAGQGAALVADFEKWFATTTLDQARRQAAVVLDRRTAKAATVPTGGSGQPVSSVAAPPKGLDAAIDRAADAIFASR